MFIKRFFFCFNTHIIRILKFTLLKIFSKNRILSPDSDLKKKNCSIDI